MAAPYPDISTVNLSVDLSNILIYTNTLTDGMFAPLFVFAFFMIVFVGSAFMQQRFTGRIELKNSFAAAGFVTFGLAVIMSMKTGLLEPYILIITIIVAILGLAWLALSAE
jgi:hypothetical protein